MQHAKGLADLEHQRGIRDVLARRAEMHERRRRGIVLRHTLGQRLHQRNGNGP